MLQIQIKVLLATNAAIIIQSLQIIDERVKETDVTVTSLLLH